MNQRTFFTIDETGLSMGSPPAAERGRLPQDYKDRPVRTAVHRDLTIELHGEFFSASTKLNLDEAMGLAMLLMLVCRDQAAKLKPSKGGAN
ncbi:MAG: hypothetical protein Q8J69_07185 [Sphingobacteriaceae bacterium]|nr:hypothetical protein [Sphingobacteriaceae bacterium]